MTHRPFTRLHEEPQKRVTSLRDRRRRDMNDLSQSSPSPIQPTASAFARVLAFLGGLCILIVAMVISLGTVVFAPLAMLIVAKVQRSRGRVLSVLGHWLTAVASVMALLALIGTISASVIPKASFDKFQRQSDFLSANRPP